MEACANANSVPAMRQLRRGSKARAVIAAVFAKDTQLLVNNTFERGSGWADDEGGGTMTKLRHLLPISYIPSASYAVPSCRGQEFIAGGRQTGDALMCCDDHSAGK
jgi:hypothetical protein